MISLLITYFLENIKNTYFATQHRDILIVQPDESYVYVMWEYNDALHLGFHIILYQAR